MSGPTAAVIIVTTTILVAGFLVPLYSRHLADKADQDRWLYEHRPHQWRDPWDYQRGPRHPDQEEEPHGPGRYDPET